MGSAVNSAASIMQKEAIQSCFCFHVQTVASVLVWLIWAALAVLLQHRINMGVQKDHTHLVKDQYFYFLTFLGALLGRFHFHLRVP